jgi:hypothetical protein
MSYFYILIAIFVFVFNMYRRMKKAQQTSQQHPIPPPPVDYNPLNSGQMNPEQILEYVLSIQQPSPVVPNVSQRFTLENITPRITGNESQYDSELDIESEVHQYETLLGKRSQPTVSTNIPLENTETEPIFTTSPSAEDDNLVNAVIWSEILGPPKGLMP